MSARCMVLVLVIAMVLVLVMAMLMVMGDSDGDGDGDSHVDGVSLCDAINKNTAMKQTTAMIRMLMGGHGDGNSGDNGMFQWISMRWKRLSDGDNEPR